MKRFLAPLPIAIIAVCVLELLVWLAYQPPTRDLPELGFSTERARQRLQRIYPDSTPHAVGTPAARAVQRRIAEGLTRLGYVPEAQVGIACGKWGVCAEVHNLIAVSRGRSKSGPAEPLLMLSAHYDSVPAGPGISDDGVGVAVLLEAAAVLRARPPEHDVVLLFNDGEEMGLLGAKLFMERHPLASRVAVALNVEARGSRGPSLMFETSAGNQWLIERFAAAAAQPVTSSIFSAVYKKLPNDTDLTEYVAHDLQGMNFAYIGGVEHYHTPLDDLEQLDTRSLRHHGLHTLGVLRALDRHGVEPASARDAIFFDLFAKHVVILPEAAMLPWSLGLIVSLALLGWALRRRGKATALQVGLALLAVPVALATAALLGWASAVLLKLGGALPFFWVAHPAPIQVTVGLCALAGLLLAHGLLVRRAPAPALGLAVWSWWAALGVMITFALPGASYGWILPATAGLIAIAASARGSDPGRFTGYWQLVPVLATALIWLPPLTLLYSAIGFASLPALALIEAWAATPLLLLAAPAGARPASDPASVKRRALRVGAVLALLWSGSVIVALLAPANTAEVPQRMSMALVDHEDAPSLRFLVDASYGPVPDRVRQLGAVGTDPVDPHPWPSAFRTRVLEGKLPRRGVPGRARLVDQRVTGRHWTLVLEAEPEAWGVGLHVPLSHRIERVVVNGADAELRIEGGYQIITFVGGNQRRASFELHFAASLPERALVTQFRLGFPPAYAELPLARPAHVVRSQFGDLLVQSQWVAPAR